MNSQKRLFELDALRGLAAIFVVLYHYTTRYDQLYSHEKQNYFQFSYGHYGVQLFFIISGFVIFMTIHKSNDIKNFLFKRFIRLYPAYIVSVIVTYTITSLFMFGDQKISIINALINLSMLQGFFGVPHIDGVYWSLQIELIFYAIVTLLLFLNLIKRIVSTLFYWIIISYIISIANLLSDSIVIKILYNYLIVQYSHLFIAGITFYLLKYSREIKSELIVSILFLCLIYEYSFFDFTSNVFTSLFFIIFYLLIKGKLKFLNTKVLMFLGSISYSLYLVHQNIGYVIINYLELNNLKNEIYLIIPITFSILLSSILTYYVEKPVLKAISRKNKDKLLNTSDRKAI